MAGTAGLSVSCIMPPVTQQQSMPPVTQQQSMPPVTQQQSMPPVTQQQSALPQVAPPPSSVPSAPSSAPSYEISWHAPALPACSPDADAGVTIAPSSTVDFAQLPGAAQTTDGKTADAGAMTSTVKVGAVSNASRVVAGMREAFRTCYQTALAEDRGTAGTARLTITVGCEGSVVAVSARADTLPQDLVRCLIDVASGRRFEPPAGGRAVIAVPVTFVRN